MVNITNNETVRSWEDPLATVPLWAGPLAILHPYVSAQDMKLGMAFLSAVMVLELTSFLVPDKASPYTVSVLEQASHLMPEACWILIPAVQ